MDVVADITCDQAIADIELLAFKDEENSLIYAKSYYYLL
jgi:hypothetical protein